MKFFLDSYVFLVHIYHIYYISKKKFTGCIENNITTEVDSTQEYNFLNLLYFRLKCSILIAYSLKLTM